MKLTSKERAINFIKGEKVDRLPFHPLVMQYAAALTGVPFSEYCLDPNRQVEAMLGFAEKYGMDCVHPSGFPYCEAGAYGLDVVYPHDELPHPRENLIKDFETDIKKIKPLDIESNRAMMNRVQGVATYIEKAGDDIFVGGHTEGPLAEYCDLRDMSNAFMDFYDYPDELHEVFSIIVENAKKWMTLQAQAGCHYISIGDAATSQISEELYIEYILPHHKDIIKHMASLGVYSKMHICGNTEKIIPHLIRAGANIIDVDHLVTDMRQFIPLLGKNQVLCGNLDPVSVIKEGTPETIRLSVKKLIDSMQSKCIVSAGCEIPKDTPIENYTAFFDAVKEFSI